MVVRKMKKDGRPITPNSFTEIDQHKDSTQQRGKIPLAPKTHSYPEPIRLQDLLNSARSQTENKLMYFNQKYCQV